MLFKRLLAAIAAVLVCVGVAYAQPKEPELTPEQKAEVARLEKLRDSLKPQRGVISLPAAKAKLNLGTGYYFLGPEDAKRVLVEGWGNSPDAADGVLGLVFPTDKTFLDDTWGAVVTYTKTDYISDKDAQSEDYDELLKQMQEGEVDENAERKKAGYEPIHLVGWAQAPSYDKARHDLIWARQLQFGQQTDHTLNYDVRHLGREGVLSLNMVSVMSQLPTVRTAAQDLAKTAEFDLGSRYADFREGDKVAGYGLAGLVAAGAGLAVAKKAGIIGVLLLFAKKGFAFIAIAGAAIVGWFRKMFGGKPKASTAPASFEAEPLPAETAEAEPQPAESIVEGRSRPADV
jgi:uncharacterized membrane-anchored protein